jgi:hypothetical protein
MRKLMTPGFVMLLLLTFPAFAATFPAGGPHTTNNDDSCDISLLPAATLLLPYFEVDVNNRSGETTLFTVTNVTNRPQIARINLWTDWGYPVINFNLYLTGYDTQSINLYDIIVRGVIAPDLGTGTDVSNEGEFSEPTNPLLDVAACDELPGVIPQVYITHMKRALTEGIVPNLGSFAGCNTAGNAHENAIGYITIDVVRTCGVRLANDPLYYGQEILWDNVLTGDFQQIHAGSNYAQGNPMVHIRATPEGGSPSQRTTDPAAYRANFERTFYSRYQDGAKLDGRQPLPARFAARWIDGGSTSFQTFFKIWREGKTTNSTLCNQYSLQGKQLAVTELTMFDEEENPYMTTSSICCIGVKKELPSTSMTDVADDDIFPPNPGVIAGWMYFNLDNDDANNVASQNWVIASMRAQGRFSTDIDATALGNGCSPEVDASEIYDDGGPVIGPSPNTN